MIKIDLKKNIGIIDKYIVFQLLDSGSFGSVYKCIRQDNL